MHLIKPTSAFINLITTPINPLNPGEFRKQCHLIDFLAYYYYEVHNSQVSCSKPSFTGYLHKIIHESTPCSPEPFQTILRDVQNKIIHGTTHWQSSNFFAYFPSSGSTVGLLGEILSTGFNVV